MSPDALWLLRRAARARTAAPATSGRDREALRRRREPAIHGDGGRRRSPPRTPAAERFGGSSPGSGPRLPCLPLDSLIDRTISAFDYDLALLARPGGRRRMANVRKLMRLAARVRGARGPRPRGFLEFAAEPTGRDEREGMAAVQVEGHDGVRVMTVHAAKGLEFEVVAVADLGRGLDAGGSDGDIAIGRPSADGERRVGRASRSRRPASACGSW